MGRYKTALGTKYNIIILCVRSLFNDLEKISIPNRCLCKAM